MFHKLIIFACSLAVTIAQYHQQPQYQQAQYQQQPQYQQAQYQEQPQYQQVQYQPQQPEVVPTPAQFPAGVDSHSCPNYPDCANPLLAVQAVAKASDPKYVAQIIPQAPPRPPSQYSPDVQQRLDRGEYIGDGDYHGEGLDEAQAPEVAEAAQYASHPSAGAGQYPAQQAASQYSAQPGAVQYSAQQAASQYSPHAGAVQYSAQQAASQYSAQPGAVQYRAASQYAAQPVQYRAQQRDSQPLYITAPQSASKYYQPRGQYAQASLVTPQYAQPAPVREASPYGSEANAIASGSEPVAAVQLPAGVDASACPNYPFCH